MRDRESKAVGTEGLGLFTEAGVAASLGLPLSGEALRDQALDQHHQNHRADIQKVRVALLAGAKLAGTDTISGDDAVVIIDRLGITGDKRFIGAIFRGWDRVVSTGQYVPSRLPQRHHRPVRLWLIV